MNHTCSDRVQLSKIRYGKGSVTYSTFDAESSDVLRLDFTPQFITADGKPMASRKDLDAPGFTFDQKTRVLRIRHDDARSIDIQGEDGSPSARMVTFDDPHLPAGT